MPDLITNDEPDNKVVHFPGNTMLVIIPTSAKNQLTTWQTIRYFVSTKTTTMSTQWPIPKFSFEIIIDGSKAYFTEVTGLDMENQVIEYRKGNSPQFSTIKMPGLYKFGNVTLKRGIFKNDNELWDWFNDIKANAVKRKTVTINLLDETKRPVMTWTMNNAWPTKIQSTDLKADGNEVGVETMELAFEGLTISNK